MPSESSQSRQDDFIALLLGLEKGAVPLNRSELVRRGLSLMAKSTNGNVFVDVAKKIETASPSLSTSLAANPLHPTLPTTGDCVDNSEPVVGDSSIPTETTPSTTAANNGIVMADAMTTVSSSCVLDVESSLSTLVFPSSGGDNIDNKVRSDNAKYRLLLYRFLLNGLAELSGERQLLMAAGPMFAAEATEAHIKSHNQAVDAIIEGIIGSDNEALKKALQLENIIEISDGKATNEENDSDTNSHARTILLGLVLYFEQKTGSSIFTVPSLSSGVEFSLESFASGFGATSSGRSKQGRFFHLVTLLTFVVAEGLKTDFAVPTANKNNSSNDNNSEVTTNENEGEGEGSEIEAKLEDKSVADNNTKEDVEGVFLSTLFTLLYRLVPLFIPLRGDEGAFHSSALPDLLRLLLQYHDPILSMHLDQHPPPKKKRQSPSENNNDSATADGDHPSVPQEQFVTVQPARCMADAAYQYFTSMGATAQQTQIKREEEKINRHSRRPSAEALALLDLHMLRYDDSSYFSCLSFIATVMLRRGELLKLADGESMAQFWCKFADDGAFADIRAISLTAESILSHAEASEAIPVEDVFNNHLDEGESVDAEKTKSMAEVKSFAAKVLTYQAHSGHKERLPPAFESLAGFLLCFSETSTQRPLLPFAALVAIIVQSLAKNTPSSAKVFSTAVLTALGGANSPASSISSPNAAIYNAIAASPMAAGRGQTASDIMESQRKYVASFPVMPVTAEELVLVFPAGGQPVPEGDDTTSETAEQQQPTATEGNDNSEENQSKQQQPTTTASARAPPSGGDPSVLYSSSHLQYLILDSRAENSFLFARLPTAIHIGSGIGFDANQLQATVRQLQDAWSSHLAIMGTGRSIIEEMNLLKLISLRLVEKGFPHVSIVDGGFKACIPYLKSGQMEFVQSPQRVRDAAAAREATPVQQQQQPAGVTRTTLQSSEELSNEIASQATALKEQAVVIKDKAAEGLKKTGETVSEAASSAAVWGASVWGRLSAGVASTREKLQQGRGAGAVAGSSGQGVSMSSSVDAMPSSVPQTSNNENNNNNNNNSNNTIDSTSQPPSSSNFFASLITRAENAIASAKLGEPKAPTTNETDNNINNTFNPSSSAGEGTEGGGNSHGEILFVTNDDDDDDDDLGLIVSVAPAMSTVVVPSGAPSSAARDAILTAGSAAASAATATHIAEDEDPSVAVADNNKDNISSAAVDQADPTEATPSRPVVEKTVEEATTPAEKQPTASTIDDLFDDILTATAPTAASPSAAARALPASGSPAPTEASPSASSKPPVTSSATPSKATTGNAFEDIFGEDF